VGGGLETAATVRRMQMMTSHNTTLRDEGYRQCVRIDRSRSTAVASSATRRGRLRAPRSGRFLTPPSLPLPLPSPFSLVDVGETTAQEDHYPDAGLPAPRYLATAMFALMIPRVPFFGYRVISLRHTDNMAERFDLNSREKGDCLEHFP